jgi:hypothetical protein
MLPFVGGGSRVSEHRIVIGLVLAAALAGGCASSELTDSRSAVHSAERLPRPGRVIVYDFAVTADEVAATAAITGHYERRTLGQTTEDVRRGHLLSDTLARNLAEQIAKLGIPAHRADNARPPQYDDLIITGEFVSIDEGSRAKRMTIGFGAGAARLQTHVVAYQVTPRGHRRLGSAQFEAGGGRMPGMLVPVGAGSMMGRAATSAAVSGATNVAQEAGPESIEAAAKRTAEEITALLAKNFARQGWIHERR